MSLLDASSDILDGLYEDIKAAYPDFDSSKYFINPLDLDPDIEGCFIDETIIWCMAAYCFLVQAATLEVGETHRSLTFEELMAVHSQGVRFFVERICSYEVVTTETNSCWSMIDAITSCEDDGFSMLTAPRRISFSSAINNLKRLESRIRFLDYCRIADRHLEIRFLTGDSDHTDKDTIRNVMERVDIAQEILDDSVDELTGNERKALDRFLYKEARNYGILPKSFYLLNVEKLQEHPIGGGSYGDVYKGRIGEQKVAVKTSRFLWDSETKRQKHRELCKEAFIWKPLDHPNVLPFLGICSEEFLSVGLVSPFMDNGDLLTYLRRNPNIDKFDMAKQICSGLAYLHNNEPEVIHGDLKCANILIDGSGSPRIADFGLARLVNAGTLTASTGINGTLRWMAPELVHPSVHGGDGRVNAKSDIYAFGMTCLEIYRGEPPFHNLNDWEVVCMVQNGSALDRALELIDDCSWLSEILSSSCSTNPESRLHAQDIIAKTFETS
ncbi:hypothetical protein ACEPAH_2826 [Sanghuangporus vaninii]